MYNRKIVEREKIDTFKTHIYVSAHFPGLVQTL